VGALRFAPRSYASRGAPYGFSALRVSIANARGTDMKHRVYIEQTFTVQRWITIEVEADDMESAIEQVRADDSETPDFLNPGWEEGWSLTGQQIKAAE
jgi:hypothetical protein